MTRVNDIMQGRFEDCPPLSTRIIKIFLSSTFSDMKKERDAIMKSLYPELKSYCREKYGMEFQILDMRWGVPSETQLDHQASELCFQEIKNCKDNSCGINFITLVGHRNGSISLPYSIIETDFQKIIEAFKGLDINTGIFEEWYIKDQNNVLPYYTLRPIPIEAKDLTEIEIRAARTKWSNTEKKLIEMIKKAINFLVDKGEMNDKQKKRFCSSVTEQEIEMGICNEDKNKVDESAAAFIREITDIRSNLGHPKVNRYIDLKESIVDENIHQIMNNIVEVSIKGNLRNENIRHFKTHWNDVIKEENDGEYITDFQVKFLDVVKGIIDKNMEVNKENNDDLYNEVLQHSIACEKHEKHFKGRPDLIESVRSYIQGDDNLPFIVYGESGTGKTSIVAKAAYLSRKWLDDESSTKAIIMLRFLGTSPGTSNIRQTIRSLWQQLLVLSGKEDTTSEIDDFEKLIKIFYETLDQVSKDRKIIIFLDSLDQLQPSDEDFTLSWLKTPLYPNVKMILSTLPKHENIIFNIRTLLEDKALFLEIKQLEQSTCMEVILSLLKDKARTVTEQQKVILTKAFNVCSLPIYVYLVFRTVVKWRSYHCDETNELSLKYTVREAIFQFFQNLENKYNKIFVRHSLAYITASRNGLSEAELEDILSLDDKVLQSIFIHHLPPQIRVPPFLWSRVRQEIGSYLVEREADNCRVLYWYHRQFIDFANEYLLKDRDFQIYIHSNMSDYFFGTYSNNKPKRFYYPSHIRSKVNLPPYTDEGRNMPSQPLIYNQETYADHKDPSILYNYRKINELPWHLAKAGRFAEFGDDIAFNYRYLITKLRISSRSSLFEDLSLINNQNISFQNSLTLLYNAIRLSSLSLCQDPSNISLDLVGRLSKYDNDYNPRIKDLLEQCRQESHLDIGFIPTGQCLESGNCLLYLWYNIGLSMGFFLPDDQLISVDMIDNVITYYDIDNNVVKTVLSDIFIYNAMFFIIKRLSTIGEIVIKIILKDMQKAGKDTAGNNNEDNVQKKEVNTIYDLNLYSGRLTEVKEIPTDISEDNIIDINDKYLQIDSRSGMAKLWNFVDDHYVYEYESGVIHACLSLDNKTASVMYKKDDHVYMDVVNLENEESISLGIASNFDPICCYNGHFNMIIVVLQRNENIFFFRYSIQTCILQQLNVILIENFKQKIKRVKVISFHDSNIVIFTLQMKQSVTETTSTHAFVYKRKTDSFLPLILDSKTRIFKKHLKYFEESIHCIITEDEELLLTNGYECLIMFWSLIDGSLLEVLTMDSAKSNLNGIFTSIDKVAVCHYPDECFEKISFVELYNFEDLRKPMIPPDSFDVEILEDYILFNPRDYKYRDLSFDPLDGLFFIDNSASYADLDYSLSSIIIDIYQNCTIKSEGFFKSFLNLSLLQGNNDRNDIIIKVRDLKFNESNIIVISSEGKAEESIVEDFLDSSTFRRINPKTYLCNEEITVLNVEELRPGWIVTFKNAKSFVNLRDLYLEELRKPDNDGREKKVTEKKTAEDDLRWIEENIPASAAEKIYPIIDSEEEITPSKITSGKMD